MIRAQQFPAAVGIDPGMESVPCVIRYLPGLQMVCCVRLHSHHKRLSGGNRHISLINQIGYDRLPLGELSGDGI